MKYKILINVDIDEFLPDEDLEYNIEDVDITNLDIALESDELLEYMNGDGDYQQFTKIDVLDINLDDFPEIVITIDTDVEIQDEEDFKYTFADYCLEDSEGFNTFTISIYGDAYEPDWNGYKQEPTERKVYIDEEETHKFTDYDYVSITKI